MPLCPFSPAIFVIMSYSNVKWEPVEFFLSFWNIDHGTSLIHFNSWKGPPFIKMIFCEKNPSFWSVFSGQKCLWFKIFSSLRILKLLSYWWVFIYIILQHILSSNGFIFIQVLVDWFYLHTMLLYLGQADHITLFSQVSLGPFLNILSHLLFVIIDLVYAISQNKLQAAIKWLKLTFLNILDLLQV